MANWAQLTKELSAQLRNLRGGAPEVMKAFAGIAQAATVSKVLDGKTKELTALLRNLRGGAPEVMKAFAGIAQAATVSKVLDGKTKELIALGIAVAVRCDDCIAVHAKAAAERGASQDEVSETLGMAIYMGAGPSAMYASHALEAFMQFQTANAKAPA